MSRLLALAAALLFPLLAAAADATIELTVKGWHCGGCVEKTVAAVRKVDGVKDATGDADTGKLTVTVDDGKVDRKKLTAAVASSGFKAE